MKFLFFALLAICFFGGALTGVVAERHQRASPLVAACNDRFDLLFQGRCAEAKCLVTMDEMGIGSSDSNLGRLARTTLDSPGPIGCPKPGDVPWVKGNSVGTVDFTCAPAPKGGP